MTTTWIIRINVFTHPETNQFSFFSSLFLLFDSSSTWHARQFMHNNINKTNSTKLILKYIQSTNGSQHPARSVSPRIQYNNSPEIHDLVRFRTAIMNKYVQTHDVHYRDMANALTPQIEDKIREYNRSQNTLN